MDAHKAAFGFLREIFPQVDLRVLKAVAIEHYNDIDSAVDFVLDEVIPSISGSVECSSSRHDAHEMEGCGWQVGEFNANVHSGSNSVQFENCSYSQRSSMIYEPPSAEEVVSRCSQECIVGSPKKQEISSFHGIDEEPYSCCPSIPEFKGNGADSISDPDASNLMDAKEMVSALDYTVQNHSLLSLPDCMDSRNVDMKNISDTSCSHFLAETSDIQDLSRILGGEQAALAPAQDISLPDHVELFGREVDVVSEHNDISNVASGYEAQQSRNIAEDNDIFSSFKSETLCNNDLIQSVAVTSHSGDSMGIEFLEDSISDAKSNKNNLLPSLEMVTKMIEEVELLEDEAKEAKYESSAAGQGILTKVEELQQMLNHAKEANDMHAGEVFGEKSILATEARELQSRILRLLDERNKYLAITEGIRQALEERLAVAQQEIEAAKKEKIEKEASAQNALGEQELVMNAILEESRKLQQESEENLKLREFLIERGRIVDMLQGEMAVICEDVLLLKGIVDGRLPLSKLQRSTMSSLSSSSHFSLHKTEISADRIIQTVQTTERDTAIQKESSKVELNGNEGTYETDW